MKYIFTLCDPAYISMLLLNILVNTNDKKEYKFINKLTLGQTLFEKNHRSQEFTFIFQCFTSAKNC